MTIISCVGSYIVFLPVMVHRVDKEGLDRGVGHLMALRAKHTHLSSGGKTRAKTDYKPFILERSITSL